MKSKVFIMILAVIAVVSLSSCRGKAAVKTVEAAEKVLQKTPKKTTTTLPASGAVLENGRYADDAARLVEEISEDDAYDSDDDY